MNDFGRNLILGATRNVTVERIVNEHYVRNGYLMTMGCIVRDENEEEVSDVSIMYTSNMIKLRALTWYNNYYFQARSKTFVGLDGSTFTGYFGTTYFTYMNSKSNLGYTSSVLGYSPIVYVSSDKTALSRDDYAVPDDAVQISWSTSEQATRDADGATTVLHVYYTNTSEESITINKILIVGQIDNSSASGTSFSNALLFEELLDTQITLKSGEAFARDYAFRLEW